MPEAHGVAVGEHAQDEGHGALDVVTGSQVAEAPDQVLDRVAIPPRQRQELGGGLVVGVDDVLVGQVDDVVEELVVPAHRCLRGESHCDCHRFFYPSAMLRSCHLRGR